MSTDNPRLQRWISRAAVLMFAVVILLYVAAALFGSGGIGYFSPDTLEGRTRKELLIPFTDVPVFRGGHQYHRYELVDYLVAKGFWSARESDDPQWIQTFRSNQQWRDGQSIFYREMAWFGKEWIEWSERHPDIARQFWPLLLTALRERPDEAQHLLVPWPKHAETLEDFNLVLKKVWPPKTTE